MLRPPNSIRPPVPKQGITKVIPDLKLPQAKSRRWGRFPNLGAQPSLPGAKLRERNFSLETCRCPRLHAFIADAKIAAGAASESAKVAGAPRLLSHISVIALTRETPGFRRPDARQSAGNRQAMYLCYRNWFWGEKARDWRGLRKSLARRNSGVSHCISTRCENRWNPGMQRGRCSFGLIFEAELSTIHAVPSGFFCPVRS